MNGLLDRWIDGLGHESRIARRRPRRPAAFSMPGFFGDAAESQNCKARNLLVFNLYVCGRMFSLLRQDEQTVVACPRGRVCRSWRFWLLEGWPGSLEVRLRNQGKP